MLETIKIVASILAIVTCTLGICIGATKLGRIKGIKFLTSGLSIITAIVFGFQATMDSNKFTFALMIVFFLCGFITFVLSVWLSDG